MKVPRFSLITFFLILLNLTLFYKLHFFLPQLSGQAQLLDLETYLRLINDIKSGINPYTVTYMQSLGPPTVFFYFLPFSIFNIQTAKLLFTLVNISCGFAMCHLLTRALFKNKLNWFLLLTLLFFSSFPARFSVEMGQPNLVICFLISLLIRRPKTKYLSVILSSILIIKTNFVISLIPLVKNNLGVVIKTLLIVFLLSMSLLSVVKPSIYSYYLTQKTGVFLPKATNKAFDYYNQSIPAKFAALGFENFTIPAYLILVLLIFWQIFKSQNLILGILASIIISPVSWQHYFAVLFPIFVYTLIKTKGSDRILPLFAFLLYWIEFPFLHSVQANFFTILLSSHFLISAAILFLIVSKNISVTHPASK